MTFIKCVTISFRAYLSEPKHINSKTKTQEETKAIKVVEIDKNDQKKQSNTDSTYKKRSRDSRKPSITRAPQPFKDNLFKWQFCGIILFNSRDVQGHDNHAKTFSKKFYQPTENKGRIIFFHQEQNWDCYFIQQKDWMTEYEGNNGRIICPRKTWSIKLGNYSWSGLKCSWGAFKSPAFQINRKSIVEVSQFL